MSHSGVSSSGSASGGLIAISPAMMANASNSLSPRRALTSPRHGGGVHHGGGGGGGGGAGGGAGSGGSGSSGRDSQLSVHLSRRRGMHALQVNLSAAAAQVAANTLARDEAAAAAVAMSYGRAAALVAPAEQSFVADTQHNTMVRIAQISREVGVCIVAARWRVSQPRSSL